MRQGYVAQGIIIITATSQRPPAAVVRVELAAAAKQHLVDLIACGCGRTRSRLMAGMAAASAVPSVPCLVGDRGRAPGTENGFYFDNEAAGGRRSATIMVGRQSIGLWLQRGLAKVWRDIVRRTLVFVAQVRTSDGYSLPTPIQPRGRACPTEIKCEVQIG